MRQGQNSKRSRGRGNNRRNFPTRHQTFDSNGPNVRIRGNAHQVHEKYLALARDAGSSGDRVAAENYLQHADHYFRMLNIDNEDDGQGRSRQHAQPGHAVGRGGNGQALEDETATARESGAPGDGGDGRAAGDGAQSSPNGPGGAPAVAGDPRPAMVPGEGEQPDVPKRRGRSTRNAAQANGALDGPIEDKVMSDKKEPAAAPARRRGRPRKSSAAPKNGAQAED